MLLIVFLKLVMKYAFYEKKIYIDNMIFYRSLSFTIYLQNIKQYCNLVAYVVLYNIGGEKGLIYNMYTILQEEKNIEGVVKTTYGIKCEEMAVNDVSPNKKEVTELIDRLNQYGLSPCHLQDVIEDFI